MFRRALQDSKEDLAQRFFSMLVYWKDKGWFRDSMLSTEVSCAILSYNCLKELYYKIIIRLYTKNLILYKTYQTTSYYICHIWLPYDCAASCVRAFLPLRRQEWNAALFQASHLNRKRE